MEGKERWSAQLDRIETHGGDNVKLIRERKQYIEGKISTNDIPATIEICRASSMRFAEYMNKGRSKRFTGDLWTVDYSSNALSEMKEQLERAVVTFENAKLKSSKANRAFKKNVVQTKKLLSKVDKELSYLENL